MKKIWLLFIALFMALIPVVSFAEESKEPANIYIFYGNGCPHCKDFSDWYEKLTKEQKAKFNLVKYETWYNSTNSAALTKVAEEHFKLEKYGVPFIIVGENYYSGFGSNMADTVLKAMNDYYDAEERYDLMKELSLEVVADKAPVEEKIKTIVIIVVVLAVCLGAAGLIYVTCKSEE